MNETKPDLSVDLPGLDLDNPILTASGTFGYGEELKEIVSLETLGGIVLKSVTKEPREGNQPPRVVETPSGMINSIGLENPGLNHFLSEDLNRIKKLPTKIIASIAGFSIDEFVEITGRIQEEANGVIDAFEMNYSCPNTEARGVCFGMDADMTGRLTEQIASVCDLPLIVKLSPNVTDIRETATAAEQGGAEMISLINTLIALEVNWRSREPSLGAGVGGLSGPAIRPVALRMVWEASGAVDIPLIGIGGINSADDVLSFLVAGATAVQVGTAHFVNACASEEMVQSLSEQLSEESIADLSSLVGSLNMPDQHKS